MNFLSKLLNKQRSNETKLVKLAVICNWNQDCGISTYTKFLLDELKNHVSNIKIFSELKRDSDKTEYDGYDVSYCWERNGSVKKIKKEIKSYNPDIIMVQHEYGIFPNIPFWYNILTFLQDYNYFVVLHSVYEHKDKFLCESPLNNIIVHTNEAAEMLRKKKYKNNLYVIPHGCPKASEDRNWNLYGTKHTIMQYGFAFEYKNFEDTIKSVKILKDKDKKYKDLYLTCYLSESKTCKSIHDAYYSKLKSLVEELGLEEDVALIKGFLDDYALGEALKTNQICVLPYKTKPEHDVFGSSGAAKISMSYKIPTIVGDCHLFDDVKSYGIPSAKNAEEIADHCHSIFSDWKIKKKIIDAQVKFCNENSWEESAKKYKEVIDKILNENNCPYKM